jgi:hypothetical protein
VDIIDFRMKFTCLIWPQLPGDDSRTMGFVRWE